MTHSQFWTQVIPEWLVYDRKWARNCLKLYVFYALHSRWWWRNNFIALPCNHANLPGSGKITRCFSVWVKVNTMWQYSRYSWMILIREHRFCDGMASWKCWIEIGKYDVTAPLHVTSKFQDRIGRPWRRRRNERYMFVFSTIRVIEIE